MGAQVEPWPCNTPSARICISGDALTLSPEPLDEIPALHAQLRTAFDAGETLQLDFRLRQLKLLAFLLQENKAAFVAAFREDLGRTESATLSLDVEPCIVEILWFVANLKKLARPRAVSAAIPFNFTSPRIVKSPRGVCLIIAPFNYPLRLALIPLAGSIAAGNTVVLKPSELCPNVNALLTKLFSRYLDQSCYRIVNGDIEAAGELLKLKFDHIFYTGSGRVARSILKAAAEHLTPVALELGGQCAVVVDETANIQLAAKRVVWAAHLNAGQTCVSPNHVLVVRSKHAELVQAMESFYHQFYYKEGSDAHGKIINERQEKRLLDLLSSTKGTIKLGGTSKAGLFQPTLVYNVQDDDALLQDEIFGPILPVQPVDTVADAIKSIRSKGSPLAIYLFSKDPKVHQRFLEQTRSGTLNINDCATQMVIPALGFGAVGESGNVSYEQGRSFDIFTYERAVMQVPDVSIYCSGGYGLKETQYLETALSVRYPPMTPTKWRVFTMMLQKRIPFAKPGAKTTGASLSPWLVICGLVAALLHPSLNARLRAFLAFLISHVQH